jgi:hypothetical protein
MRSQYSVIKKPKILVQCGGSLTTYTEEKKQYDREYRKKNRERIRAYKKNYYEKNREAVLGWNIIWQEKNPEKFKEAQKKARKNETEKVNNSFDAFVDRKYCSGRAGAKNRNLSWELTRAQVYEFLKNNPTCALSGRELKYEIGALDQASLDRIDCSKGYTVDNIQIVSQAVNCSRWDLSISEFKRLCEDVSNFTK